jgi:hypothetical protein
MASPSSSAPGALRTLRFSSHYEHLGRAPSPASAIAPRTTGYPDWTAPAPAPASAPTRRSSFVPTLGSHRRSTKGKERAPDAYGALQPLFPFHRTRVVEPKRTWR